MWIVICTTAYGHTYYGPYNELDSAIEREKSFKEYIRKHDQKLRIRTEIQKLHELFLGF